MKAAVARWADLMMLLRGSVLRPLGNGDGNGPLFLVVDVASLAAAIIFPILILAGGEDGSRGKMANGDDHTFSLSRWHEPDASYHCFCCLA